MPQMGQLSFDLRVTFLKRQNLVSNPQGRGEAASQIIENAANLRIIQFVKGKPADCVIGNLECDCAEAVFPE